METSIENRSVAAETTNDDAVDLEENPFEICTNSEPVDLENNRILWLPPEPEDEEDEVEENLFVDDDDDGDWGYLRDSTSFRSGDNRSEEHKKALKNAVEGHIRALAAHLLQVENLLPVEENDKENWLEIITALSWEAAMLVKPDMSKNMEGYVKVKRLASGLQSESKVVKGVVCNKNVAHRHMKSKVEHARLLILGGAIDHERGSNALSSFETTLQQEWDRTKMALADIIALKPDILLVEKSVSRYAQEYLFEKNISLVLNIKRPVLERIARSTGAQIVPSIDNLSSQKLGYCDMFRIESFSAEAGQAGKELVKTLMFFEGCPKPLCCTILLRGANEDELKKVKRVVQYGVFAAYRSYMEISFLADEGAPPSELVNFKTTRSDCSDVDDANRNVSNPSSLQFDVTALEEGFPPSPSDHQSIFVSLSSRCIWKGTVCERSLPFRIEHYRSFDKPFGRFLRDHFLDLEFLHFKFSLIGVALCHNHQIVDGEKNYTCCTCKMPAEAHVQCYTHEQCTLTICVKILSEFRLPGENDGKIWMWHRCLKCLRPYGVPPASRRVVMSGAAWGLSFGKFLDLSFSNHAVAASCGHSLHRDCLHFFGFGMMIASFGYASIDDVHSLFDPSIKLGSNFENQAWPERVGNEVVGCAKLLFSHLLNALRLRLFTSQNEEAR